MRWLLSLGLLFDVNVVFAREIFIGPSGSNSSGTGSMAAPYQTLLHVLEPANELGGLSGLTGSPGSNFNFYSRSTGACVFADGRPGAALASGNLSQWRSALGVDGMSVEEALSLAADGKLLANSAAIKIAQTQAGFNDDIDQQQRSAPWDIGADEFGVSDLVLRDGFE